MKKICIMVLIAFVSTFQAADLKGNVTAKPGNSTDIALRALSKELKNVQNKKGPIVFKTGSAEIDVTKSKKTLKAVHEIITTYPGFLVQIEGHTDNVGNAKKNMALSQKRAESVMNYLIKIEKTPAKRLKAKGFGDTKPIADNKTEKGRGKNRRVDFSVFRIK